MLRKLSIRQARCRDMIGGQYQIPAISFQGENEVAREATPRLSPSDVSAIVVPCRACMSRPSQLQVVVDFGLLCGADSLRTLFRNALRPFATAG